MSITTYEPPAAPAVAGDPTGGRLVAWAEALQAARRIGTALCTTAFAPAHFKNKPEEAAVAILYGDEVGFTPTAALQNIYVISGKPAMYARAMVSLVQSKGHEVWTEEANDRKVVVCGRRRGSSQTERSEWTIEKARKAGYTNNKKYDTAPEDMLYARAASTVCRRVAADALAGIAYSVEELELDNPATVSVTRTSTAAQPTTVQRKKAEPVEPEPSFDEPSTEPSPVPPKLNEKQRGAMFAAFQSKGIPEVDQLPGIVKIIGRSVEHRDELTSDEFRAVMDAIDKRPDADPTDPADDALPMGGE